MWKEKLKNYWLHDENNIKGFFDEYRWLSNFEPCVVYFDGRQYPSSENAYMAAKTLNKEQRKIFETVLPYEAKKLGREIALRPDWNDVKFSIMYDILLSKFTNMNLRNKLLSTGDKYLQEANWWFDKIWGVCQGEGENNLGKMLMEIRAKLS